MAQIQLTDELVREYLLWRGLANTSKALESELRTADRERGFRVDRMLEQLLAHVHASELAQLRDYWQHLDSLLFNKLEIHFQPAIRKLENGLYKLYLVVATSNGRTDKVTEFLARMQPELQSQPELREWFMLPYVSKPEESSTFGVYWTRGWQDALLVSLHNFLATVLQCMPAPTLAACEAEAALTRHLREENTTLKAALANANTPADRSSSVKPFQATSKLSGPSPIIDDFYLVNTDSPGDTAREAKGLRSLIRQMGSSPVQSRGVKQRSTSQN